MKKIASMLISICLVAIGGTTFGASNPVPKSTSKTTVKTATTSKSVQVKNFKVYSKSHFYLGDYTGTMVNGTFNGQGTFVNKNIGDPARTYTGTWVNSKLNGKGVVVYGSYTEEGNFINGLFTEGKVTTSGGMGIYGTKKDRPNGTGVSCAVLYEGKFSGYRDSMPPIPSGSCKTTYTNNKTKDSFTFYAEYKDDGRGNMKKVFDTKFFDYITVGMDEWKIVALFGSETTDIKNSELYIWYENPNTKYPNVQKVVVQYDDNNKVSKILEKDGF